jgi:hypothetical protein
LHGFSLAPSIRGSIGQAQASNRFGGFRCGGFCGEKASVVAGKTRNNEPDYGMTDAAHDFSFSGPCSYGKTLESQSGQSCFAAAGPARLGDLFRTIEKDSLTRVAE